jgi:hypothetical protein
MLIFDQSERQESSFSLLYMDIQFSQYHLLRGCLFPPKLCLWHLFEESNSCGCLDLFWELLFYSIAL